MLKAEKVDKDSIKSISTVTYLKPIHKNSDTGKSSKNKENLENESTNETPVTSSQKTENFKCSFTPNNDKVIKKKYSKFICKKCKKLFRGKAGFTHHKANINLKLYFIIIYT